MLDTSMAGGHRWMAKSRSVPRLGNSKLDSACADVKVSSVERYDTRNAVGISEAVKWQHVLPFLPGLTQFAAACDQAVSVGDAGMPRH